MAITRTAWTDDDGSGTTGTVINNAVKTTLYDELDGRWSEMTITSTGTQNNVSITTGGIECDVLRCNNASDLTITGIAKPASPAKPGKKLLVMSVGAGAVYLPHQSASSTAANRIQGFITTGIGAPLAPGVGVALLEYDETSDYWRLVVHEQGLGITPAFNAADFGASGGGTWTVGSGDITTMRLYVRGRMVTLMWYITTSQASGSPADLRIGNGQWGGYTVSKTTLTQAFGVHNGGGVSAAYAQAAAAGIIVSITRNDGAAWNSGGGDISTYGQITFEVT